MGSTAATRHPSIHDRAITQCAAFFDFLTVATNQTRLTSTKLVAEMIHEGDIDLDPEYQRGRY